MKTLDRYVLGAMIYISGWSIAFFISWILTGAEPSTLEGCILSPGVVELICTTIIKKSKGGESGDDSDGNEEESG